MRSFMDMYLGFREKSRAWMAARAPDEPIGYARCNGYASTNDDVLSSSHLWYLENGIARIFPDFELLWKATPEMHGVDHVTACLQYDPRNPDRVVPIYRVDPWPPRVDTLDDDYGWSGCYPAWYCAEPQYQHVIKGDRAAIRTGHGWFIFENDTLRIAPVDELSMINERIVQKVTVKDQLMRFLVD